VREGGFTVRYRSLGEKGEAIRLRPVKKRRRNGIRVKTFEDPSIILVLSMGSSEGRRGRRNLSLPSKGKPKQEVNNLLIESQERKEMGRGK